MLLEANEALDEMENIVRNKHPAAGTGRYQPADLSRFFKLLHHVSDRVTAKNVQASAFKNSIVAFLNGPWRAAGLNLDGKHSRKNGLIDLLSCLPKILEENATIENLSDGFVLGGMIDKKHRQYPSFNALMSCCRRWGLADKERGVSKEDKDNLKRKFRSLMAIQLQNGQLTAEDMLAAGLPRDTLPDGREIETNKPSGSHAEHLQYAKNMNSEFQRKKRQESRLRKAEAKYNDDIEEYKCIERILARNKEIEEKLLRTVESGSMADVKIASFMKPNIPDLKDFIHCRKFNGKTFHETKLFGSDRKLNKTLRKKQTAAQIEAECSFDKPCLVWLAWTLRSDEVVLKPRQEPVLQVSNPQSLLSFVTTPETIVPKKASDYLRNSKWLEAVETSAKGVTICAVDDRMMDNADKLVSLMLQRLNSLISIRVDEKCHDHITLKFVRDNVPSVAAQMCLAGHVVSSVETSLCDDRLLVLPSRSTFRKIDDDLGKLEGCYLCYDREKDKWIRSGFASGLGTCLGSRIKNHQQNSLSFTQMRSSRFYRYYPSRDAPETYGSIRNGHFEDIDMYCAMALDPNIVDHICSVDGDDSLFVWSKEVIKFEEERSKLKDVSLRREQITSVSYLWEICYDQMLAKNDNISDSGGFEGKGLRAKKKSSNN